MCHESDLPPSTLITCPVIYFELTTNLTVLAISFSDPIFLSGILAITLSFCSSVQVTSGGSSIAPGAIALTLTSGANSLARTLVIDSKPPLAEAYIEKFATPLLKFVSVIFTIVNLLIQLAYLLNPELKIMDP